MIVWSSIRVLVAHAASGVTKSLTQAQPLQAQKASRCCTDSRWTREGRPQGKPTRIQHGNETALGAGATIRQHEEAGVAGR